MTRKLLMTVAVVAIALAPSIGIGTAEARGGGFGGGGFHGGGFGGRGFYGGSALPAGLLTFGICVPPSHFSAGHAMTPAAHMFVSAPIRSLAITTPSGSQRLTRDGLQRRTSRARAWRRPTAVRKRWHAGAARPRPGRCAPTHPRFLAAIASAHRKGACRSDPKSVFIDK